MWGAVGQLASLDGAEGVFCVIGRYKSQFWQRVDRGLKSANSLRLGVLKAAQSSQY